jgi:LNS2 (Lipin/Ned1/Smp2)
LEGIAQERFQLPEGPVIMSPDRLLAAIHREMIMRKPEEFKMAVLKDIQRLFDANHSNSTRSLNYLKRNPFYAGFGNRTTDSLSYRSVGIPVARIFSIDSYGDIRLDLIGTSYKESYKSLTDLVDHVFPPLPKSKTLFGDDEFNELTYWRSSYFQPSSNVFSSLAVSGKPTVELTSASQGTHPIAIPSTLMAAHTTQRDHTKYMAIGSMDLLPASLPAEPHLARDALSESELFLSEPPDYNIISRSHLSEGDEPLHQDNTELVEDTLAFLTREHPIWLTESSNLLNGALFDESPDTVLFGQPNSLWPPLLPQIHEPEDEDSESEVYPFV